ncbi:hypothetical protein PSN45_003076 [Yamadazyma tenuis]|uniref:Uncharacterized protein n=1 Tax=Candida tenuis (strain ATCC 10573 / BCRC 21748 / CBS 615 / JCM 9827 / NBRC 10315 / NRRL Y-1498 / VKM Y-70) TaxID=590646 RepID=G3AZH3_CANTC|nr:uncharacterized protein CANTEDRAFT_112957 [Yamadazyma tenuis ATCC 10573]EGV66096.1 hypothetical protein CANTEDRAFT_112957 [Yamadazyma tenuis ATCC 10573]WEJ95556.1 hypothetical protein PSN45_003076 [Yamadazyma tenuis]
MEPFRADVPVNLSSPVRIALLGGAKTGKTSILSKLIHNIYTDTYYPTVQTNSMLFTYTPESDTSRVVLGAAGEIPSQVAANVELSPVLKKLRKPPLSLKKSRTVSDSAGADIVILNDSQYYRSFNYKADKRPKHPTVTPILVEAIDTPAYKSDFIPFLESSLYTNLDKDVLKNLANEPRRHVSTLPLLVASGAGELNGSVDGYFYVYSAIPSYSPPSYDDYSKPDSTPGDDSLTVLHKIKTSIDEAWKEYYTYKSKWEEGKEADIYSVKTAIKNFLSSKNFQEEESKKFKKRGYHTNLLPIPTDPADSDCPPPIWIICTHGSSPLASPKSIENGRKTAAEWGCGFICLDIKDASIDYVVALMIREIVERKRLQQLREQTSKN